MFEAIRSEFVQTIARKLGGNIQVTSKPGDIRFQVWLPWAETSEPGKQADSAVALQGRERTGADPAPSSHT
jgi:hypothetical protein